MNGNNDTSNSDISKMKSSPSSTEVVSSPAASLHVPAYDQWQQWAQRQKQSKRKELGSLLHGDVSTSSDSYSDEKVQEFMELPRKQAIAKSSLLDDDDDEDECETDSKIPWKMMQRTALLQQQKRNQRSSLLDDEDSNGEDQDDLERELPRMPLGADALFLPPTSLKRSSPIVALPPTFTSKRNLFVTAPSFSSRSGGSSLSSGVGSSNRSLLNKSLNFDSITTPKSATSPVSGISPAPLSLVTVLSTRRRYTLARNGSPPAV